MSEYGRQVYGEYTTTQIYAAQDTHIIINAQ